MTETGRSEMENSIIRCSPHVVETNSKDFIRQTIHSFYKDGSALIRELSERDYGIDAILELFHKGMPTGQIAFLQFKGTQYEIKQLVRKPVVSCQITKSNAMYVFQSNIPVILIYASIGNPKQLFYYDIRNSIDKINNMSGDSITLNIPIENDMNHLENLFESIRNYYK